MYLFLFTGKMTDSEKAARATVTLGSIVIDGFRLPEGSYRMSQAQAAEAIGESPVYALRFLSSKDSKASLGEGYTDYKPESVEVESAPGQRGQTRINALPLEVVAAYWLSRAYRGNKKAFLLCWAMLTETLERRFDRAFGVTRLEDEWDQRLADGIIAQLENDLSGAFEEADTALSREKLLEQQLRELGVEPWALPEGD
jgi:hypothetical protein